MGGTSRLEILQLLRAGTVEEQLHADLQRQRAEPAAAEARERRRGAGVAQETMKGPRFICVFVGVCL